MIEYNKDSYAKLLLSKSNMEHWEIIVETNNDKKLYEMFFGEFKKQKKLPKKMNMESLVYIVFGRRALEELLSKGFQ